MVWTCMTQDGRVSQMAKTIVLNCQLTADVRSIESQLESI